jgi:hypothetical protein
MAAPPEADAVGEENPAAGDEAAGQPSEAEPSPVAAEEAPAAAAEDEDEEGGDDDVDRGALCVKASENLIRLMAPELEAQLQQMPEEQRAQAQAQMKGMLDVETVAAKCEEEKPDPAELECVVKAKTKEDLMGCKAPSQPPRRGG